MDWWSIGAIIFEMITGSPPFVMKNGDRDQLFEDIKKNEVLIPEYVSEDCRDLLKKIFVSDPAQRIGGGPTDGEEIMKHPWFNSIDWQAVYLKKYKPPFKPKLVSEIDVQYIDSRFTLQPPSETPESQMSYDGLQGGIWEDFTYPPPAD